MPGTGQLYQKIHDLFEQPFVFNAYQSVVDGGKGRQIQKFLRGLPYSSVVDIGCGTGNWSQVSDAAYLGIDTSASFIAGCKKRYADDPTKRFIQADAASLDTTERFDLGMLISVLHHLSDDQIERLLSWLQHTVRYFFVLDLYPIDRNPLSKWLYQMDRGSFIRQPHVQVELLTSRDRFRLVKQGDYFAPTGLYRHTLLLLESARYESNSIDAP